MPDSDWFEQLTGFAEQNAAHTHAQLRLEAGRLHSRVNGRSYAAGRLELPSLAELRAQVAALEPAPAGAQLQQSQLRGDARALHHAPEQAGALVQVASQFNLLEMTGPNVCPEDGITRYQFDPTQGPACAIAAGAGTLYRQYFVPMPGGQLGQSSAQQINTLADLGAALGHSAQTPLWRYRNGYVLCSAQGLAHIHQQLQRLDETGRDALRALLRIGLHWDVEVTDALPLGALANAGRGPGTPGAQAHAGAGGQLLSQAYCSALPVAYSSEPASAWAGFAQLVLEAAYEATLLAGVLNQRRTGNARLLLTRLGGGAFGNRAEWIDAAIARAIALCQRQPLHVLHVSR